MRYQSWWFWRFGFPGRHFTRRRLRRHTRCGRVPIVRDFLGRLKRVDDRFWHCSQFPFVAHDDFFLPVRLVDPAPGGACGATIHSRRSIVNESARLPLRRITAVFLFLLPELLRCNGLLSGRRRDGCWWCLRRNLAGSWGNDRAHWLRRLRCYLPSTLGAAGRCVLRRS